MKAAICSSDGIQVNLHFGELPEKRLAEKGIKVQRCACPVDQIPSCKGNC